MEWNRPALPDDDKVQTTGIGLALMGLAFAGMVVGFMVMGAAEPPTYSEYTGRQIGGNDYGVGGWITVAISSGLFSLGLIMACVGSIIAEIRRAAFEAAARAGEVKAPDSAT
ncbi:hypothetical protein D1224_05830 [Henriciella barbarensis]|uniref:Uncharacterized protein n=1 Tax=Henriciella barbarensis TaxID=86342 RepID=A0A399QXV9_9PROT|nr:hypothetical protein [Henriciella barbarensis]RIJ23780.1 hypothetical protein D1224_05830 [Henriciella barbarensis]